MNAFSRMLPRVVREAIDSPEAVQFAVFAAWASAAGPAMRRVATPVEYDGRTLHVATVDTTWKTQLDRLSPQLLFKINGVLGSNLVMRLAHRVDAAAVSSASTDVSCEVDIPGADLCERLLEPDVAKIADPRLRALFLRTAARCLARRTGRPTST